MRRHPAAQMHADGGNLRASRPHTREARHALRWDAELAERVHQNLLDRPHIQAHVAFPLAQVKNRIPDYLPRTMIRHIAAAIRLVNRDRFRPCQQMLAVRVTAERDDVGMLDKEQLIRNQSVFPLGDQALLQSRSLGPIHQPQILNLKHGKYRRAMPGDQTLIASPYTLLNASPTAS